MVTERKKHHIRIFSLPDIKPVDSGGIPVFTDFDLEDPMGIALYTNAQNEKMYVLVGRKEGYILVSDQQVNNFIVFKREEETNNPHQHKMIAKIPFSTIESVGADVINFNFGAPFEKGIFIAMSNGKVFHYYDWNIIQKEINKQAQ